MKRNKKLSTTQIIALGFILTIFVGAALLTLPISSASGSWTPFIDALFTSTTSVCVTGLVVVSTATYWSLFGQSVILLLIQIGGLGIIAITSSLILMLHRKFTLTDAVLLESAFNLNGLSEIVPFLKKVFIFTFGFEFAFFLLYLTIFVPDFGTEGVRISLFHSVSTFCNAGIDIIGDVSLYDYRGNVALNILTMLEIIIGGIGFVVMIDVHRYLRSLGRKNRARRRLSLHTKIVLATTLALIFVGALLFFIFEYSNPKTIGDAPLGEKILASFFQSVTTRTAGFATFPQSGLRAASVLLSCILMFIGGSPIGTAGGIKTTTITVLILSTASTLIGKKDTVVSRRRLSDDVIKKATSVFVVAMIIVILACMLMFIFADAEVLDMVFEVVSALGTVGLSRDLTATLGIAEKIIIILCMYLGRIGPISLVMIFSKRRDPAAVRYSEEDITVG